MHQIIAAIRVAISAIIVIVWVPCRITGRLIRKIQRSAAGPSIPSVDVSPHRSARRPSNDSGARQVDKPTPAHQAVRTLAQKMAAGTHALQDMHQVPAEVVQWLSSLDRVQLCRLVCAKAEDLAAYMNGRTDIRGMPRYLEPIERPAPRRTADRELAYRHAASPTM